jgi:chromosome partitioning protein
VKGEYDYAFIDCPPALGWLTLNAFTASDEVIVIVSLGYFELDSIVQISKTCAETQRQFYSSLQLRGLLFTMSDPTVNTANSFSRCILKDYEVVQAAILEYFEREKERQP